MSHPRSPEFAHAIRACSCRSLLHESLVGVISAKALEGGLHRRAWHRLYLGGPAALRIAPQRVCVAGYSRSTRFSSAVRSCRVMLARLMVMAPSAWNPYSRRHTTSGEEAIISAISESVRSRCTVL